MIDTGRRHIKNGWEYEEYFTGMPKGDFITVKKEPTLSDTISLMKRVINETLSDTSKIAMKLQGASVKDTCKNIWNFFFHHFQYKEDEKRKEQIRRPLRSWRERFSGIDCDCFTVAIGSTLTNLGIDFIMRMTRYEKIDFEHIYPVVINPDTGNEIIIDCVVHKFNYEVPYTEKQDEMMELQYLNGIEGNHYEDNYEAGVGYNNDLPIDAQVLFRDEMELQGLEGKAERQARKAARKERNASIKQLPKNERLKARLKQGFHTINKANPAIALLRAGILTSMKLNLFKVASHLRFAYWNESEALKNGMDLNKFRALQQVRAKMEKIFHDAGGNTDSLKKSILSGKGNRNNLVQLNGLGAIISNPSDGEDIRTILGDEMMYDEGFYDVEGLNGFGIIATSASVAAASGVMASIAKVIKKIGVLFNKGTTVAEQFKQQDKADNIEEATRKFSVKNIASKLKEKLQSKKTESITNQDQQNQNDFTIENPVTKSPDPTNDLVPSGSMEKSTDQNTDTTGDGKSKGVGGWIKDNPVPATLIGLGLASGVYLVYRAASKPKVKTTLNGTPKKKKTKSKSTIQTKITKAHPKKKRTTSLPKVELL